VLDDFLNTFIRITHNVQEVNTCVIFSELDSIYSNITFPNYSSAKITYFKLNIFQFLNLRDVKRKYIFYRIRVSRNGNIRVTFFEIKYNSITDIKCTTIIILLETGIVRSISSMTPDPNFFLPGIHHCLIQLQFPKITMHLSLSFLQ